MSLKILDKDKHHKPIKPMPSKKYRIDYIMKNLKEQFKLSWNIEKRIQLNYLFSMIKLKLHLKRKNT